ncbi:MAG TPA: histidine--tRNA ligase [Patescibacteria group bacterium]|jgi:histidyl-tRNA synthetase|nr:histidine--tRNA ligase [Patescibacteria group bacterium]
MAFLSTQPYRGTRDMYPEDKRVQNYIFGVWRRVAQSYGYEEYDAPLLEPFELFAAKSGQDLVNDETYQFIDRGDRKVVIRPEMTPSVSRMIAARRQELAYPARWFSICNFMRYERPQRGRERQFWQLNVDIFGVADSEADSEIITMAHDIMKAFGATNKMYSIRVNSRAIINVMMAEYLELDIVQAQLMIKLFDKRAKISHEDFRDQAAEIFDEDKSEQGLKKIAKLVSAKTVGELPKSLVESSAVRNVQQLFTHLHDAGVTNAVFDITLMRGFDYYSGIVFEVFDNHPDNRRAMFGGGRYDGLVSLFGVEPIPTVGMAPGATTIEDFLRTHELLPKLPSTTEVYVVVLGDSLKGAQDLASRLRGEDVNVEVDITGRKLDKQIKTAIKKNITFMLFIGQKELDEEQYTLKDVAKETEQTLSFERLVTTIKDHRHRGDDNEL